MDRNACPMCGDIFPYHLPDCPQGMIVSKDTTRKGEGR